MLDFTFLAEFSRHHCVAICAFLVPANLFFTTLNLFNVALSRPFLPMFLTSGIASFLAFCLFLHVSTWLMVGVVMTPTFVLLSLGTVCLSINLWAILGREKLQKYLRLIWQYLREKIAVLARA
jgi:hypothetical protein